MVQQVDSIIAKMVETADSLKLLTHYREDLTKHDRLAMERIPDMDYIWSVSETSSDVYAIGLHPKVREWFNAMLQAREKISLFVVSPRTGSIKPLSREQAALRMDRPQFYRVDNGMLIDTRTKEKLGTFVFDGQYQCMSSTYKVHYDFVPCGTAKLSDGLILSLALYEAEFRYGIWFSLERAQKN